jgi:hypothetical protein
MKLGAALSFAFVIALPQLASVARAQDRHEEHRDNRDQRAEGHHDEHLPPRAAPPAWKAHPPGPHPANNGWHPGYHPHAVRVLQPRVMRYGEHPWRHWGHPEFVRPVYYWDWAAIRSVTCIAEDSYGDQYPVTVSTFGGFGLVNMTSVEDNALDRCYDESGGDQSCYLATCNSY